MNRKPNVIFILADDMGYGDFSAFSPEKIDTPALDRLVEEGTIFSNCYAASPVCAPARASIMTGRYPLRTGVTDTLDIRGLDRLNPQEETMADLFRQCNYATGLVGKWHLGGGAAQYHPNRRGFDWFYGFSGGWSDYWTYHLEENERPVACNGEYITEVFSRAALEFIRKNKNKPFLLHLAYTAPHYPLQAPEELIAKYRNRHAGTQGVCMLRAMIEVMDHGIGRILDLLDELDLSDDTILVFSSDNGPDLHGEGEMNLDRYNGGLRGEKTLVYEGGIKVPAVMRYPGHVPARVECSELVHGIDWLPTLASMCSIDAVSKRRVDGLDFSPVFSGEPLPPRKLFWQWNRYTPEVKTNAAVRDSQYKLLHTPVQSYLDVPQKELELDEQKVYHPDLFDDLYLAPFPDRPVLSQPSLELYNLLSDPGERNNILDCTPRIAGDLEDLLNSWFQDVEQERAGLS